MIHFWPSVRGCGKGREKALYSFLDGELSEARRAALAAHLKQCALCAAALHRLVENDRLLAAIRPEPGPLSPAASRALLERALVEAGVGRGGPGRGLPLLAWSFAVALFIVATGAAAWWSHPAWIARDSPSGHGPIAARPPDSGGTDPAATVPVTHPPNTNPVAPGVAGTPTKRGPGQKKGSPARDGGRSIPPSPSIPPPSEQRPPRTGPRRLRLAEQPAPVATAEIDVAGGSHPDAAPPMSVALANDLIAGLPLDEKLTRDSGDRDASVAQAAACGPLARQLVSAALDGDPRAGWLVADALRIGSACDPEGSQASGDNPPAANLSWPRAREGGEPGSRMPLAALPEPQLLVIVTSVPAPSAVAAAPEDEPGAGRPGSGAPGVQETASTDDSGQEPTLAMLGSEPWQW